jgi:hypothetical protein
MPKRLFWLFVACNAPFIAGCFGSSDDGQDPTTDPACQLDAKGEKSPGYPYDVAKFGTDVMPVLAQSCGTLGCHASPQGNGGYIVWANAKPGDCDFGKTFNSTVSKVDLVTASNSRLTAVLTGGSSTHPLRYDANKPELVTLQTFITNAAAQFAKDSPVVTPPAGVSPFKLDVFTNVIQPMLVTCEGSGCHSTGSGGFTLKSGAAAGNAALNDNFIAVTSRANLDNPQQSLIYVQATVRHASGASRTVDATQAAALLAWIEDAKKNNVPGGPGGAPGCAPVDRFNLGVFRSEVLPILSGAVDLNQGDGLGRGPGCMSTQCHGIDRGPGKLSLVATAPPETQLQNFACFVNLSSPSASNILNCPLDGFSCPLRHPGQDVLGGNDDFNYQRLLAFIYGAKADVSPLDFAFFVRNINPIFNDINAVEGGAQGRTCADTFSCHGVSIAGQVPPNGSDFPIIPAATGLDRLTFNFVSATGFTNFLTPNGSSLFLYPTNLVADRNASPFATGLTHPGGTDFAANSNEANLILTWAGGLRPDNQGFNRNWLVVGDFPASLVSDQTLIDETTIEPGIFDNGGGFFNRGEWDGLFAANANIDLNAVFPRAQNSGRIAYAVAYITNTVPRQIQAQIQIATNNPVRIYINGTLMAQNDQGGGNSAFVNLPAAGTANVKATKVLIKLLQRANDAQFAFTAQFKDQFGTLLTDVTRELVFTLAANGGI